MANEKHLALINQNIDVWNKWRDENPEIVPDLSGNISNIWYHQEAEFRGIKVSWGIHPLDARQHL